MAGMIEIWFTSSRSRLDVNIVAGLVHDVYSSKIQAIRVSAKNLALGLAIKWQLRLFTFSAKSILRSQEAIRDRSEILINTTMGLTRGSEWPMAVRNTGTCVTERAREAERVLDMMVGASSRACQILLPLLKDFKASIAGATGNTLG